MEAGAEDCCVKVAVHIRPLIGDEKAQGCKDCVTVVAGKPQVQIGMHSFTFDHVYGSTGSPSSVMFEECIAPLVDGLFQGYNATVLAYGQTGSGKTYTMGTGFKDGCQTGIIPLVMKALFNKIETLKHQTEFQVHVSFIEILKEEVHDLLDSTPLSKPETANGHANGHSGKVTVPGKPPIQIRETSNGVITLAGSTEVSVSSLKEMAACLEQGSLSRATGSTNMNNQSSRSHAIFTITLEQMRKLNPILPGDNSPNESTNEEYLCAKLHLVDLAGSERAKRTGSDGLRFKEGVHINKGLLALGNVISALGDEKKRKEGLHVPYRDSKLTRLLQDSLGGNSRTVMIACISPADINAEETLNTLKYANRARNIQNKPVVNRDPMSSEMLKMRQQLEYLQAELCARGGGSSSDEVQVLKERITWLEAANEDLCRELHEYRSRCAVISDCEIDAQDTCSVKSDGLKRGLHSMESPDYQMSDALTGDTSEVDEVAKEWEHTLLQNSMDKELNELNKRLEQKESEMKLFGGLDTVALKQHFGKKIMELEDEKKVVQQERDHLLAEVENLAASSDGHTQKMQDVHTQKLKTLEAQILDLRKKQESQVQLLKQKQKSDAAAKRLQDEIQYIKSQKVQLQQRIKQEAEQFRQWKASREKELLQLRKEGRKNEYERHKLQAINQRQKMVLQRKTEEASMATKRLKELLEARKSSARDSPGIANGNGTNGQSNEKSLQRWLDHELEVLVNVHEVRFEYERQSQVRAALAEELALLKQVDEFASKGLSPPRGKNGFARASSMSPNARIARISSLENMLSLTSNSLVAMASQLSEAEERERAFTNRGRWNQLRSMGDAKNLLQYMFNSFADARCQLWEKEMEIKEMKDHLKELVGLLRQILYRALHTHEDSIDARLTLASLLLEECKEDEAILLLSPPKNSDSIHDQHSDKSKPWWLNENIKLKLSHIYRAKGMLEEFVGTILPLVRESLHIEGLQQQKVKRKKKLSSSELYERVKLLDEPHSDSVFHGFRPVAPSSELLKASRAKRLIEKKAALKQKRKAEAMAARFDLPSGDSDDEFPRSKRQEIREPPLPNLLKDDEYLCLLIDVSKALASLKRYWEALEIINLTLRLASNSLSPEQKEGLRSLGAQVAYNTTDPKHGFDCVKYIVQQHPESLAAWNCYYKVTSRLENRYSKHYKFLHGMRVKHKDCVPPIVIIGHQFTVKSHHQDAAREYLEAYKLLPENPMVNICVGTALINLALGFRLQNKHQCIAQGLAFLYNNLRLFENSQEALYNIARAYHHVGLVSLAASYYEKVIAIHEKDYPIPKLPNENPDVVDNLKPGYCDLRREAAYNLHLIYKKSGAVDLARQVLKDHCTF